MDTHDEQLVVYTAIFGNIDQLYRPQFTDPKVSYVAFIDTPAEHEYNGWRCKPAAFSISDVAGNTRRLARKHKALPHRLFPEARHVLWIDGSFTPVGDPRILFCGLSEERGLAVFKHSQRTCVYQELEACVRLQKDDVATMRSQVGRYRAEGYPYNNGLVETGLLLRRNDPSVVSFNEMWWSEMERGSLRDQLSFNYVAWKTNLRFTAFDGNVFQCPNFEWRRHR